MRWVWLGFMIVATLGCFVASLVPKFDSPKFRPVRGGMFLITGLSTILIFVYLAVFKNDYKMPVNVIFYALGGYLYVQGAVLYILRFPERCKPGVFDLCVASHRIFHFCVVGGCALHFWSNYNLFIQRENFACPVWIH